MTLIDLMDTQTRREILAQQMASDLIKFDAISPKSDSIRALLWCARYRSYDLAVLIDDARQVAMQEVAAREMTDG
jgi:hypothetical protein